MPRIHVVAVLLLIAGCHSGPRIRPLQDPTGPHVTLLTYNVNWGSPGMRETIDAIRALDADIVCLQETTPRWEQVIRRQLGTQYRFMAFQHSRTRTGGGAAFLARASGHEVAHVRSETNWFDGWIMCFPTAIGDVQVLNVHLRPPVSDSGGVVSGYLSTRDDRVREMERFIAHCNADMPIVVAGDFNDGPDSEVVRWLEDRDWLNAVPQFDRGTETWRWRYGVMTLRRRMDHILYPRSLACYAAEVIQVGASDHFPVVAVLGRREGAAIEGGIVGGQTVEH